MAESRKYELRLFAEGVRVPIIGASRSQANGGRFSMTIQVPPTPFALQVPPNTLFHVFVRETGGSKVRPFVLYGEARMKTRGLGTDTDGGRYAIISCEGIESDWSQFKLGFNIGQDANLYLPRLMRFFVGLSTGEGEMFEGYDAAMAGQALATIAGGDRAPFLDLYLVLSKLVEQMGPVSTIIHIANNLNAFSPLYRQLYSALKVQRRIGFAENRKVSQYLGANTLLDSFLGRVKSLPNDASLFDLMQTLLPDTLHHYTHIASPRFNAAALDNKLKLEQVGEVHPSLIPSLVAGASGASTDVVDSGVWMAPVTTSPGTNAKQRFGGQRDYGGHTGQDYPCPLGTPVTAARGGTVETSAYEADYGNLIWINHQDGYKTRYAHLSVLSAKKGDVVRGGQQIGLSGNTGGKYGYHLHFDVKLDGTYVNPLSVLGTSPRQAALPTSPTSTTGGGTGTLARTVSGASPFPTAQSLRNSFNAIPNVAPTAESLAQGRSGAAPPSVAGSVTRPSSVTINPSTSASSTNAVLATDPRIRAYLDVIARYESANGGSKPLSDQYRTLRGGGLLTGNMSRHPFEGDPNTPNDRTDSGRYQFIRSTWRDVAKKARLTDFTASSQDLAAIQLLRDQGQIANILSGNIRQATSALGRGAWYALPSTQRPASGGGWAGPDKLATVVTYYSERMAAHTNGTAETPVSTSSGSGAAPPPRYEITFQYENTFGACPQCIIKPQLEFSPPPLCNVIFPHQITNLQFTEDQRQAPTRLLMYGNPVINRMFALGAAERTSSIPMHFAPRYLRFLFDSLRGGNKTGDILSPEGQATTSPEVEAYVGRLKSVQGSDTVRLRESAVAQEILGVSRVRIADKAESTQDALQGVLDGSLVPKGNPTGLLGMYTYDELFRGIIPAVSQFPFISDDAVAQSVDQDTIDKILANAELAVTAAVGADPELLKQRQSVLNGFNSLVYTPAGRQTIVGNLAAANDSVRADRGQQLTGIDLYASHQFSTMRRSGGQATVSGPLNMNVVAGFPAAFYETSVGWIFGTVQAITDNISIQGNAQTTVQLSNCVPMNDENDPVYKQFRIEAEAEMGGLRRAGLPENPNFLDDKYSVSQVGKSVYSPILGQGSVVDWLRDRMTRSKAAAAGKDASEADLVEGRKGDLKVPSLSESLGELIKAYLLEEDPYAFTEKTVGRDIVTEGEMMQRVLEAKPIIAAGETASTDEVYDDYWAPYAATTLPADKGESFMTERRDWAVRYREDYAMRDGTFSTASPFYNKTPDAPTPLSKASGPANTFNEYRPDPATRGTS